MRFARQFNVYVETKMVIFSTDEVELSKQIGKCVRHLSGKCLEVEFLKRVEVHYRLKLPQFHIKKFNSNQLELNLKVEVIQQPEMQKRIDWSRFKMSGKMLSAEE